MAIGEAAVLQSMDTGLGCFSRARMGAYNRIGCY